MTRTGSCECMARVYGVTPLPARPKNSRRLIRRSGHISHGNATDKIGQNKGSRDQAWVWLRNWIRFDHG
jgi:hypothetical protein